MYAGALLTSPGGKALMSTTPFSPGQAIGQVAKSYATGGKNAAVQTAVTVGIGAIGTAVPAVGAALAIGEALGFSVSDLFVSKSVAGWNRTVGRVYRAMVLGYVTATPQVMRLLKDAWIAAGDKTGAQFWDRLVSVAGFPTEKGGTKQGYGSGAPAGSKTAEATPGFSSGLTAFLNAVG